MLYLMFNESVNRRLPVLEAARGLDSWCRPEGSQPPSGDQNELPSKPPLHNKRTLLFLQSFRPPSSTSENEPGSRSYESSCGDQLESLGPYAYHHFERVFFVLACLFGMDHMHGLAAHILQHSVALRCSVQASRQYCI